jgi:hypothetical protein
LIPEVLFLNHDHALGGEGHKVRKQIISSF